jgi:hypothetical protein
MNLSQENFLSKKSSSSDIMKKKDDLSKHKVLFKIIDFLLEECSDADKADLKADIFINVCKFLREFYNCTESMILPGKTFETLTKLLCIFDKMSMDKFETLVDTLLQPLKQLNTGPEDGQRGDDSHRHKKQQEVRSLKPLTSSFIELINFLDKPVKYRLLIEVTISLLAVILNNKVTKEYKKCKPKLIQFLSTVLRQSDTVWKMCLKFEDKYTGIATIKE